MLAQTAMSAFAFVHQVPWQADVGIDLVCTLAHGSGSMLRTGRTFGLQVKSLGRGGMPEFAYGGRRGKRWRKSEIRWLCQPGTPFFACVADLETGVVRLYDTSLAWEVRWGDGWAGKITLIPGGKYGRRSKRKLTKADTLRGTDGRAHRLHVGRPIVELPPPHKLTRELKRKIPRALDAWAHLADDNLQLYSSGIPCRWAFERWTPNEVPTGRHRIPYWSRDRRIGRGNVTSVLTALVPGTAALLLQTAELKSSERSAVVPLAQLMARRFPGVRRLLKEHPELLAPSARLPGR
jgi:hypothetical protein